jgi:hypothetical protein
VRGRRGLIFNAAASQSLRFARKSSFMASLLTGFSGADRRIWFYRFNDEGLYRGDMLTHCVNPDIDPLREHWRTCQVRRISLF